MTRYPEPAEQRRDAGAVQHARGGRASKIAVRLDGTVTFDGSVILIALLAVVGVVVWAWDRFSEPSVESAAQEAAEAESRANVDAGRAAIDACRGHVLSGAQFPDKAEWHADVEASSDDDVNWSIVGKVDLLNAEGAMLPYRYGCVVRGSEVESGGLRP